MPLKDKLARRAYMREYEHRRKATDPEWYRKKINRAVELNTPERRLKSLLKAKADPVKYAAGQKRYKAKWYAKNREIILQRQREKRKTPQYQEAAKIRKRNWYRKNPELAKGQKQRAYKKHYAKFIHRNSIRRARKHSAKGSHTFTQWMDRVRFYGWRCVYCRTSLTNRTLTKDHRIALKVGGTNFASNLVPACMKCNCSKGHRKLPVT